jgi:hypothetical protein
MAATAVALLSPMLRADELPEGKPVKYSDPTDKEESPGATTSQSQKELLERLQVTTGNRKTSLDGLPAPSVIPPSRPAVQDSKTQEMIDRRKDWIFSTPEQLILGRDKNSTSETESTSTSMGTDDGNKQKLTPMEEFYLNLLRPAAAAKPTRTDTDRDEKAKDDSRAPAGLRDKEDQLKQLILSETPANTSPSSLSGVRADGFDFLGIRNTPDPEQTLAQKARAEEYRQLYGMQSPQASMKELLFPTVKAPESTSPLSSDLSQSGISLPDSLKASEPSSIFAPQVQVGMIPTAPQIADVNARALNPAILSAGSMRVDPKPVQPNLTPPRPTFQAPRRIN